MNPHEQMLWKSETLDEVLKAIASSRRMSSLVVFKGARILNLHLKTELRQSLDLDSNLLAQYVDDVPDRRDQQKQLENELTVCLTAFFMHRNPVKYEVMNVSVKPKQLRPHPLGFDAFVVRLNIRDRSRPDVRGLPALTIDVSAPEQPQSSYLAIPLFRWRLAIET